MNSIFLSHFTILFPSSFVRIMHVILSTSITPGWIPKFPMSYSSYTTLRYNAQCNRSLCLMNTKTGLRYICVVAGYISFVRRISVTL